MEMNELEDAIKLAVLSGRIPCPGSGSPRTIPSNCFNHRRGIPGGEAKGLGKFQVSGPFPRP
jgi:hypothetical protein